MKKLISLLLALVLVIGLVPAALPSASAASTLSGTCGATARWSFNAASGTLTVSGTGMMGEPDENYEHPWYVYRNQIRHVVVEEGITGISLNAFVDSPNLVDAKLPDSLLSIGGHAFAFCNKLESITLPPNLQIIGDRACPLIKQITIPRSVTTIDYLAIGYREPEAPKTRSGAVTRVPSFRIYGYPGSAAEAYAWEHNFDFYSLEGDKRFSDVKESDYFAAPVHWAVWRGITAGTSALTFSPSKVCTRAEVMTFLWRTAGSPKPKSTSTSFKDVKKNAYYAMAVAWAVENGITTGTSATTFSPNASCTRGQIVTFLWKAAGARTVSETASFTDVDPSSYYAKAIDWAVHYGISSGTSANTFSPNAKCTRAQVVTFLWRMKEAEIYFHY